MIKSIKRILTYHTVITVLVVCMTLFAGYGGWFSPAKYGVIPGLLVLCYPIIIVVACIIALWWLLCRRWWLGALVILAMLATWPSLNANFPVHMTVSSSEQEADFKVMSFNVEAWPDVEHPDTTQLHENMRLILAENADFVVLQQPATRGIRYDHRREIHPWLTELEAHYHYRSSSTHDGVEFLSKYPFRISALTLPDVSYQYFPYIIRSTDCFAFDIELPQLRQLRIIGAYMTSFQLDENERHLLDCSQQQWWKMPELLSKLDHAFKSRTILAQHLRDSIDSGPANIIFCCDMNDVPQSHAYRIIAGDDMKDAFCDCHMGPTYTYRIPPMLFHIDHILYRGALRVTNYRRIEGGNSDHYPITATFSWTE